MPLPFTKKKKKKFLYPVSTAQLVDWYSEGPGFNSRRLHLNFQLEKGCGRDSMQYTIIF